jgi:DNA-directed RNA polymerase subunit RPC12/RpoP
MPNKFIYKCTSCGKEYPGNAIQYLCPECDKKSSDELPPRGILKVLFAYENLISKGITFNKLKQHHWLDLLPINDLESLLPFLLKTVLRQWFLLLPKKTVQTQS